MLTDICDTRNQIHLNKIIGPYLYIAPYEECAIH